MIGTQVKQDGSGGTQGPVTLAKLKTDNMRSGVGKGNPGPLGPGGANPTVQTGHVPTAERYTLPDVSPASQPTQGASAQGGRFQTAAAPAASWHGSSVEGMYNDILGRKSDPGGLQFYIDQMERGKMNEQQVREDMLGSDEYRRKTAGGQTIAPYSPQGNAGQGGNTPPGGGNTPPDGGTNPGGEPATDTPTVFTPDPRDPPDVATAKAVLADAPEQVVAKIVTEMPSIATGTATAAEWQAALREVQMNELSSTRMDEILDSKGPLMTLADIRGREQASKSGNLNSSYAAGASMRAMAEAATPLALQEAEAYMTAARDNQDAENRAKETNAQRKTEVSVFNTGEANRASETLARLQAETNLANVAEENAVALSNRDADARNNSENATRGTNVNTSNASEINTLARQGMVSDTAVDLANIEGQFKEIISQNDTAARWNESLMGAISDVTSNPEISATEANGRINKIREEAEVGFRFLESIAGLDLSGLDTGGTPQSSRFNTVLR